SPDRCGGTWRGGAHPVAGGFPGHRWRRARSRSCSRSSWCKNLPKVLVLYHTFCTRVLQRFFGAFGCFWTMGRAWCTHTGETCSRRCLLPQGAPERMTVVIAPLPVHLRLIQAEEAHMTRDSRTPPVVALTEAQRQVAMERFAVLQPHLE